MFGPRLFGVSLVLLCASTLCAEPVWVVYLLPTDVVAVRYKSKMEVTVYPTGDFGRVVHTSPWSNWALFDSHTVIGHRREFTANLPYSETVVYPGATAVTTYKYEVEHLNWNGEVVGDWFDRRQNN